MSFIDSSLNQTGFRLFSAYQILEQADRTYDPNNSPYTRIKNPRKEDNQFREEQIEIYLSTNHERPDLEKIEVFHELRAARRMKVKADARRQAEREIQLAEEANVLRAQAEGTMSECGCCYGDYPLNRMIHCDASEMHWFCRRCALRNAETEVGQSKYDLYCMSMDGCDGRFAPDQR